jgi:hypothetical protein
MITNRYRGEITATLDNRQWQLCLTLSALAELEAKMGEEDIGALAARFSSGRLSAKDMLTIIAVGLRGGGHDVSDQEAGEMRSENGVTGYAQIVAELLSATFSGPSENTGENISPDEVRGETPSPNPPLPQKTSPSPGK